MKRIGWLVLWLAVGCGGGGGGTGGDAAPPDQTASNLDLSTDDVGSSPDLTVPSPATTIPSAEIMLGAAACGGAAPADQTLAFMNTGGLPLTYTATIPAGGAFSLAGADSTGTVAGTVAPGASASLTIHGSAVPASSTAGTKLSAVLTVITNVPNSAPVQIMLSEVATGGTLTLAPAVDASNPANANFGMSPYNIQATIPLTLSNVGNAPVSLTITAPNDPLGQFGLNGAAGTVMLAGGATVPNLQATFKPSTYTQTNASSVIGVSAGAICGASANTITFQGQGSGASVMSTPGSGTTLNFMPVHCGTTGLTGKQVTLSNSGTVDYVYVATLGQGASSPFNISSGATGTAAKNGGNASLTVTPKDVPQATTPGALADVLTIAPQTGMTGPTLTINLSLMVTGAQLAWQLLPSAYNNVSAGGSQSQPVTVVNSGNLAASPTLSLSNQSAKNPYSVSTPLSTPIAATTSGAGAVAFSPPPGDFSTETAQLDLVPGAGDVICGALPKSVQLSGTGLAGGFGVMPSSLSFGMSGLVPCKSTAPPQSFTLTNNGNADYTWTASLGRTPSPFMLSATSGTVTKGGMQTITVTPAALPFPASTAPNAYGDVITISTNIDSTLHTIALNQTAQGAILGFSTTSIDFGGVPLGQTASQGFDVINSGNAPANVTLADARQSGPTDATYQVNSAATANFTGLSGTQPVNASFAPGANAGDAASSTATIHMTVDSSTVLCDNLPADLNESGLGDSGHVLIQPAAQLTFTGPAANGLPTPPQGNTYCGTQASPQQITVSNTGTASFAITAIAFGLGGSSPYSYTLPGGASLPATVMPNMSIAITVNSIAAPSTFSFPGNFDDTITITTNAPGDTPTTINLVQSPYGAVLQSWLPAPVSGTSSVAFGDVAIGGTKSISLGVTNGGNAPATIAFTSIMSAPLPSSGPPFSFTQNAVVPANNGAIPSGGQPFDATFSPPTGTTAGTTFSGSATVTTVSTPLCAPLPATAMGMSGKAVNAPLWGAGPNPILFDVMCGAAAGSQKKTITIVNSSQDPTTITGWAASVSNVTPAGFAFALSKSGGGAIAPGATDSFDVMTAAVPQDPNIFVSYSQITATITITVTGGVTPTTQTISVTQNLYGLALSFEPTSIKFPVLINPPKFQVHNTKGNLGVPSPNFELKMSYTAGSPHFAMSLSSSSTGTQTLDLKTGIAAGTSLPVYVFDNASPTGSAASVDVVSSNGMVGGVGSCWPLPSPAVTVTR